MIFALFVSYMHTHRYLDHASANIVKFNKIIKSDRIHFPVDFSVAANEWQRMSGVEHGNSQNLMLNKQYVMLNKTVWSRL